MGLFGGGPRISPARDDGKMPWSPTVVNINRRQGRGGRRNLIIAVVIGTLLCCVCSTAFYYTYGQKYTTPPGATPTRPAASAPTRTPPPGWTVIPSQPGSDVSVMYQFATFTPRPPVQSP